MTDHPPAVTDRQTIDFGAHLMPNASGRVMHEYIERTAGGPLYRDPEHLRDVHRGAGVDRAVLSQPPFMGHGDADLTAAENDELLDVIDAHDEFYGLAAVPTAAGGEAAAAEFERCLDAGYNGGAVETRSDGIELTDPEIEPVLSVADRTGAPLLVHPKLMDSLGPDVLDDTWKLNAVWGREVALCASICKTIHTGVFDRYPDLTLVYHHMGGNVASMLGRVELQLRRGFWPGLDETKPYDEFRRQLEEHVHIDTAGYAHHSAPLRVALEEFPATNLLFGTDIPFENRTAEHVTAILDTIEAATSATDARRIRADNALDLLVNVD